MPLFGIIILSLKQIKLKRKKVQKAELWGFISIVDHFVQLDKGRFQHSATQKMKSLGKKQKLYGLSKLHQHIRHTP